MNAAVQGAGALPGDCGVSVAGGRGGERFLRVAQNSGGAGGAIWPTTITRALESDAAQRERVGRRLGMASGRI